MRNASRWNHGRVQVVELEYVETSQIKAVALLAGKKEEGMKIGEYWKEVAKLGGWQGSKNDGPPGWLTIWRGWREIELAAKGIALALASSKKCVDG